MLAQDAASQAPGNHERAGNLDAMLNTTSLKEYLEVQKRALAAEAALVSQSDAQDIASQTPGKDSRAEKIDDMLRQTTMPVLGSAWRAEIADAMLNAITHEEWVEVRERAFADEAALDNHFQTLLLKRSIAIMQSEGPKHAVRWEEGLDGEKKSEGEESTMMEES